ncbi:MAG: hypothetical protein MMC33_002194 [Icmadophila ericetorum]|nr:hypothetical protein [Icmadophila ericetorum]
MPAKLKRKAVDQPVLKLSKKAKIIDPTDVESSSSDDIGEPEDEDSGADLRVFAEKTKAIAAKRRTEQSENNVAKFKLTVEKREKALIELIRQKAEKMSAQHAASKARLKEVFESQLSLSIPRPEDKNHPAQPDVPSTATRTHPLHQKYSSLLSVSNSLLQNYDALSVSMSSHVDSLHVGPEWTEKSERFRALVEAGRVAKTAEINWMVLGEKVSEEVREEIGKVGMSGEEGEAFGFGVGVLRDVGGKETGMGSTEAETTWAMQSKRLRKNVARLMRHVPVEEKGGEEG